VSVCEGGREVGAREGVRAQCVSRVHESQAELSAMERCMKG
jgi:hypothetical protein